MGYTGIIGDQGAGKTLFETMIAGQETIRSGKERARIAANYDIAFSHLNGLYKKKTVLVPDFYRFHNDLKGLDLERMKGRHVFFDDIQALFDCHYWDSVPPEIRLFFATHRHYGCQVTYSAPSWSRVDKDIRIYTNRLLRVIRRGRLMMVFEYGVKIDEKDATGQAMMVIRRGLLPHFIWLPFTPKDEIYPLLWRTLRRVAKVVGKMYDSWAPIKLAPHLQNKKSRKHKNYGPTDKERDRDAEAGGAEVDGEGSGRDLPKRSALEEIEAVAATVAAGGEYRAAREDPD